MIAIIAPNHKVYEHYVRNRVRYIHEPNQLRGIDPANTHVVLLSNWYEVNNQENVDELYELLRMLQDRGTTIQRTEY